MVPHGDWEILRTIDYGADISRLEGWMVTVIREEPPIIDVRGLWFGVVNFIDAKGIYADMYFAGTTTYDPGDEALLWTERRAYCPLDRYARSASLRRIYEIAYSHSGLGNEAEWPLCLGFAATAVRTLMTPSLGQLLDPPEGVGVAVGFDEGDMLKLGELSVGGFALEKRHSDSGLDGKDK